jgi:ABC-type glutathione transport system ATPase component
MTHRLTLHNLRIRAGSTDLIDSVHLTVRTGELLAIVGASGAGKSLTGRALVGMVPFLPGIVSGTVEWQTPSTTTTFDLTRRSASGSEGTPIDALRGKAVAWIPQDAGAALIPVFTVERQLRDTLRHAKRPHTPEACTDLLRRVGFATPDTILGAYPHTLSGGMARRVQVALGLALGAPFLVADEPTTGLDRPVQARLVETLAGLRDSGTGIVLISHDLRLVRRRADRVMVVDAGRVVADGPPSLLDDHPHPAVAHLRGQP